MINCIRYLNAREILPELLILSNSKLQGLDLIANISEERSLLDLEIEA
jgi:hypothetical protein